MDDISAAISQVLGDPEKMRQIQSIAASLGLGGSDDAPASAPAPAAQAPESALNGLLGSLGIGGNAPQAAQNGSSGSGFDVGGLAGLLRSSNPDSAGGAIPGGFDMGVLLKLQQAMANISTNRSNIDLLMALKPRLSEPRAKKVDDAIRVMQVVQFLPLLKETGLFGQMDSILGGLGSLGGGLGGMLGNLGGGLNGLLNNLTGRKI